MCIPGKMVTKRLEVITFVRFLMILVLFLYIYGQLRQDIIRKIIIICKTYIPHKYKIKGLFQIESKACMQLVLGFLWFIVFMKV